MDQAVVDYIKNNLQAGHSGEAIRAKLTEVGHSKDSIDQAFRHATGQPTQGNEGSTPPGAGFQTDPYRSTNAEFGFFQKIGLTLSDPNKLFQQTRHEGIWPALKYITLLALLVLAINLSLGMIMLLLYVAGEGFIFGQVTGLMIGLIIPLLILAAATVAIVGSLILAGLYHLLVLLMGGKAGYAATYKALTYGATPGMILSPIPLLGLIGAIWNIVLMILGIASYHTISKTRAAVIILVPIAFVVVISILMIISILSFLYFPGQGDYSYPGTHTPPLDEAVRAQIESNLFLVRQTFELNRDPETGYRDLCHSNEVKESIAWVDAWVERSGSRYIDCSDHRDGFAVSVYSGAEKRNYLCTDHTGFIGEVRFAPTAPETCN